VDVAVDDVVRVVQQRGERLADARRGEAVAAAARDARDDRSFELLLGSITAS
jgi:hypothetical protein